MHIQIHTKWYPMNNTSRSKHSYHYHSWILGSATYRPIPKDSIGCGGAGAASGWCWHCSVSGFWVWVVNGVFYEAWEEAELCRWFWLFDGWMWGSERGRKLGLMDIIEFVRYKLCHDVCGVVHVSLSECYWLPRLRLLIAKSLRKIKSYVISFHTIYLMSHIVATIILIYWRGSLVYLVKTN